MQSQIMLSQPLSRSISPSEVFAKESMSMIREIEKSIKEEYPKEHAKFADYMFLDLTITVNQLFEMGKTRDAIIKEGIGFIKARIAEDFYM